MALMDKQYFPPISIIKSSPLYPALRRAGLRQVSFHSLRHSNASFRIQAGQNIKYIQGQLGHASINMTMDVYGHLFNDLDFNRRQVDLLESVRNPLEKPLKTPSQQKSASVQVIDFNNGAGDRARTGDVQLGKLTFYH
jgi:hypothetical protein